MKCIELKKDFYYVGVIDHSLKIFDVAVRTDFGSSYNSYLLKTPDGVIVFEGNKGVFEDEYIDHLKTLTKIEDIKYLFVTHTEPDHSGAIEKLLDINPNITIVASFGALSNLEKITRKTFNKIQMQPSGSLTVGGYDFQFVSGLLLHWPDVMFTYIKQLKVLISCDAFGAHYASDAVLLSKETNKKAYHEALVYYFDHIMSPFATYVKQACERVRSLDVEMICPGHGPVIDENPNDQIQAYFDLATSFIPVNDTNHVTIVYASAYGYTRGIAEYLRKRFVSDKKKVSFYEIDVLNFPENKEKIIKDIYSSGLILFGSPTIVGDAVGFFYDILNHLYWTVGQGKRGSAFGDYGWSGEAVNNLSERMRQLKFTVIPGYKANFKLEDAGKTKLDAYYETLKNF
jgi:NADH oxidase (H2O-forming)